eukprot:comp44145_c0_seq1/m.47507 comp44145_c0_seq1/g.47507  ORF comp44145_c0_seq1/g.47507 comp44145_c0_seq1/m.47507 type:complete len:125 (-) comp44145_c0_seq1:161-535(-)
MGRLRRKRMHKNNKELTHKYRLRNRTRDLDQIHEDMKEENVEKLTKQPIDPDLPGLGQHYCITCAKYFVSMAVLEEHKESKPHRRRLKQLAEEPYTQEEAERAAGMGPTDKGNISKKEEAAMTN